MKVSGASKLRYEQTSPGADERAILEGDRLAGTQARPVHPGAVARVKIAQEIPPVAPKDRCVLRGGEGIVVEAKGALGAPADDDLAAFLRRQRAADALFPAVCNEQARTRRKRRAGIFRLFERPIRTRSDERTQPRELSQTVDHREETLCVEHVSLVVRAAHEA